LDYNQFVNILKITVLLLGLALVASLSAFSLPVNASQSTGYDLALVVNAYRAANGYYPLNPHAQVMSGRPGTRRMDRRDRPGRAYRR